MKYTGELLEGKPHEQFLWGGTGNGPIQVPRQPFTRHGYSRFLVHWDLRESMTEADIEIILERAKERYPGVRPRVISDNGPQFIALAGSEVGSGEGTAEESPPASRVTD
jgi:hypothetical protein